MADGPTIRGRPLTTVITDSTPLIYLAAIGKFDLLGVLYGQIIIPSAVYEEVVIQGAGRPALPRRPGPAGLIGRRSATRPR